MAVIGQIVVYIIVACALAGGIASIVKPKSALAGQFIEGMHSVGPIFVSVAGILAAVPLLQAFIQAALGPLFSRIGADPSMAAGFLLAIDMGGYHLADTLALTRESWIISMVTSYLLGAIIVFTIPVGLGMIEKKDNRFFALGILSGVICMPIGVLLPGLLMIWTNPSIRDTISTTDGDALYQMSLGYSELLFNLIPLCVLCLLIAIGLYFFPDGMIKGFRVFGRFIEISARIILIGSIVEIFTGLFSNVLGWWGFDPIVADAASPDRALELSGFIALMLAGAFPMVYLIQRYLSKPMQKLGSVCRLSEQGTAGIIAASANVLALFPMFPKMQDVDKVKTTAFASCAAYLIGDHLSFTANYQPNLIVPIFLGKLVSGILAVAVASFVWKSYQKKQQRKGNQTGEAYA